MTKTIVVVSCVAFLTFLVLLGWFEWDMRKTYDVPLPELVASADPAVIARGSHLAESIGRCHDCHGADLASGRIERHGPLGTVRAPNITRGQHGIHYSDAELARLLMHGIKREGRSVVYMPSHETQWLAEEDVRALVSYVRAAPAVDGRPPILRYSVLAAVFDRLGFVTLDVASRIDHEHRSPVRAAPTAAYGKRIAALCTRCHGEGLSGGRTPGEPPSFPVPLNLTPHETGLASWRYEDFDRLLMTGVRKNGATVRFMPTRWLKHLDDTEKRALWAYLRSLPPTPFGER